MLISYRRSIVTEQKNRSSAKLISTYFLGDLFISHEKPTTWKMMEWLDIIFGTVVLHASVVGLKKKKTKKSRDKWTRIRRRHLRLRLS